MKKFIQKIKEIWSIEELRKRILLTLGLILVYRFGSFVVLPGIDASQLDQLTKQGSGGLFGLINIFAGGAFSRASVLALGVMPYISASIAIQLLTLAVPYFQKMQKEGESGRRKINQYTRYLTVIITAAQASGYVVNLKAIAGEAIIIDQGLFWLSSIVILTAGTMLSMWIGERITDKGVGNGISFIIMVGIMAGFPQALNAEIQTRLGGGGGLVPFVVEIMVMVVIVMGVIMLVQGTRRIPVQYAKRVVTKGGKMMQMGGVRQYVPLKINQAGVMPIIFAQAIMFIPATLATFFGVDQSAGFWRSMNDFTSIPYNIFYAVLIMAFTYFYTALVINPIQMADDLKRNGGFIPGVKPGRSTAEFIDTIMSRITLPGSFFLAMVAVMPAFAQLLNVNNLFAVFFGGSSLLIMVGVILDTLQMIESYLLMRHYDGLTKTGRIKGRSATSVAGY